MCKNFSRRRIIEFLYFAAAAAKSLQTCPTLCDPMDCSLPGFSVHGILQARTLEWVAISFSNVWKWNLKVKSLSRVWLLETPWTAAYQALPSVEFSGQQYWSGVPLPSLDAFFIYPLSQWSRIGRNSAYNKGIAHEASVNQRTGQKTNMPLSRMALQVIAYFIRGS